MAEKMSKEQATAFEKAMKSSLDALDVFQRTGQRNQFVAASDQLDAYRKEFNSKVKIKVNCGIESFKF